MPTGEFSKPTIRENRRTDDNLPLIARVLAQSECRVLHGQAVPASDKLVSLFEPHADIIGIRSLRNA
jgi:IS5 family transposase